MTHKISSIEPPNRADSGFSQKFVVGDCGTEEAQLRITRASGLRDDSQCQATMKLGIVKQLMRLMYCLNPYAKVYQHARQILASGGPTRTLALVAVARPGSNPKRYNLPTVNKVAMIVEGDGTVLKPRHIVLKRQDGDLKIISNIYLYYFPLCYPLLFPYGQQQWDNLWRSNTPQSGQGFSHPS
ncbi:hypothetical protein PCANC_25133 [Puccinia coronata f. sp. avenae]|uniref:Uncharacterized protein n=1 Tax=Puccinia coronata f. sp. avenae TaxID=200324 RepID=A0A2N5U0M0_9BASI|nr:hypothetical protein PCANC_25133 [Puccinia coronata f. sp. avenae]